MAAAEAEAAVARLAAAPTLADAARADLVIEAVFEDRAVKKAVIEQVEAVIRETTIFASNTSTLPITGLAENSKRPDQFVGVHFFSPVEKMMLTEVILGDVSAQVEIQAGRFRVVSMISRESAEELRLEPGVPAVAVIKSTNVVVEKA